MKRGIFIASLSAAVIVGAVAGWLNTGKVRVNGVSLSPNIVQELKDNEIDSGRTVFADKELESKFVKYTYNLSFLDNTGFFDRVLRRNFEVKPKRSLCESELLGYVSKYNVGRKSPVDAFVKRTKKGFVVKGGSRGTKIERVSILSEAKKRLGNGTGLKPLELKDCTEEPQVTKENLAGTAKKANKYLKWSCAYKNGAVIKADSKSVKVTKKGRIKLDSSFITEQLTSVVAGYNTAGSGVDFRTHSGKKINVSGGTWGMLVDTAGEFDFLESSFKSGKPVKKRVPVFSQDYKKIGGTYVEVSLSDQHVWVYKNYKLKMESDCVTGDISKGHGTPRGVYFISECIPGKYLVGDGYRTWVNRWMRLTNMGVGLHDATWRGSFGGRIYTYNGSHGCINLPYGFASNLYKMAYTGMPCIIY